MMKTKIAVFGREEITSRVVTQAETNEDMEVIAFNYEKAEAAVELIEKAFMCDIYLFSEPLAYLYAREKIIKKRLPAIQVAFDEYMILSTFYRIKNHHMRKLERMSIDVLDAAHVEEVLRELNISDQSIYACSYGKDPAGDLDSIVEHHRQHWETGKIDYAVTSIQEVEQQLRKLAIPTIPMIIPERNIELAVAESSSIATLNKSKSAQIVAGYVRIKDIEEIKKRQGTAAAEYLFQLLEEILTKFAKKTSASVVPGHNQDFILFGTRGVLDHITNHFRDFPLNREIERKLDTKVDIGFGLGLTAGQAVDHAKLAMEKCSQTVDSSCYIVNDRQDIIGPLGIRKPFNTSKLYQALIHQARLNNELSYNFIDFIQTRNNEPFSSSDIAAYYSVTKRSAERTINKMLSGEVIKAVGEEKPYVKGRPRKLFTLNQ
ncbi:hypothetical protein [Lentibacillus sediminis]|uniref:hypothetical protein n=1 Tax=Lentibacillus sediminis TaxID=1940529 RepID=UPI001EFDA797|nr:hypothetical protein [Lentibacillus sediminis]